MLFTETAYAQVAATAPQENLFVSLLPLILMAAVFYFLVIRPQMRREKARHEMRSSLQKGDHILTTGGIVAQITKLGEDGYITVTIASGVDVRLARSAVEGVVDASALTEKAAQNVKAAKKATKAGQKKIKSN